MKCLGKCPCTSREVEKIESKSEDKNITVGSKSVSSTPPPNNKDDLFQ